ncbi:MAG: Crp/Fnr family transcriptional regulator [Tannerellaceae bacterium]|jgi:CRP-like cAMP-binding protein|nr:Crp/Fnr family transcriptional regulator [Tannerellaceae bacterium]
MIGKKIIAQQMGERVSHIMSDVAAEKLASILVHMEVGKNEFLLKEGDVSNLVYYVKSGLLRQFSYKNGKELTEHFVFEGNVFINIESFFHQKPTHARIEALEPVVLYGIPYKPFMSLIQESHEISFMYCHLLETMLLGIHKKINEFRLETANERYLRLLKERPEIIRRVPLVHIASYLLMSPETLSRVRAGILNE